MTLPIATPGYHPAATPHHLNNPFFLTLCICCALPPVTSHHTTLYGRYRGKAKIRLLAGCLPGRVKVRGRVRSPENRRKFAVVSIAWPDSTGPPRPTRAPLMKYRHRPEAGPPATGTCLVSFWDVRPEKMHSTCTGEKRYVCKLRAGDGI